MTYNTDKNGTRWDVKPWGPLNKTGRLENAPPAREIEALRNCRCPECGEPVENFFDHVDQDCTGTRPEDVAAGRLFPKGG